MWKWFGSVFDVVDNFCAVGISSRLFLNMNGSCIIYLNLNLFFQRYVFNINILKGLNRSWCQFVPQRLNKSITITFLKKSASVLFWYSID